MTRPRSPGVHEGIVLRMQIQPLVDQLLPPSNHRDVLLLARMFGIADALCYELADQLLKEMAGECSPEYVAQRAGLPPVTETTQ